MKKAKPKAYLRPTLVFVIPLVFSLIIGVTVFKGKRYEVLLVQPNVDPYKDKFTAGEEVNTFRKMLELAEKEVTENTSYVIFPETAVVEYLDEDHIQRFKSIRLIDEFLQRHPQVHVISGVSSYNFYEEGEKPSPTARTTGNGRQYESYNTSMEMGPEGDITLYHKSKLVPGVEKMPYPQIFSFLEYFTLDMGGISGSLGSDNLPTVFKAGDKPDLAPLICYESVFPDLVRSFTSRGAKFIVVMTNDGWWGNTPGYKQHMYYASLRAIENRQEVVRSANTGISCHISATGKILDRTEWWQTDILKASVLPRQADTFYSRHGDYIGKIFSFFGVFFILGLFVRSRTKHT